MTTPIPPPMPMRHDPVTAVVLELARYLGANRDASDSADGIARWWFAVPPDRGSLMSALAWLKQHGFVEEVQAADGHVRYRRNDRSAAAGGDPLQALIDSLGSHRAAGDPH